MARTKASVGAKISSGKSSKARCSVAPPTSTGSTGSSEKSRAGGSGGGNPVCPRETPKWQRPITNFFITNHKDANSDDGDGETAGTSKRKPKKNIIASSDEDPSPEKPKNRELDESIVLETLSGENSHKLEEYYSKDNKGKGVGKKTKGNRGSKKSVDKNEETKRGKDGSDRGIDNDDIKGRVGNYISEKGILAADNIEGESDENERGSIEDDCKSERSEKNGISESIEKSDKTEGKENICDNIENGDRVVDNIEQGKDNGKERSKREREDRFEEETNICKKIKVN